MDGRGPSHAADRDSRLVWRLFSPSARQLTCQMHRGDGRFELLIADDQNQQIIRSSFDDLALLHEKATALREALEARGYAPVGYASHVGSRTGVPSEPRAAFCGLIECAELLSLDKRDVAAALRDAATMGLVAIGLQDSQMTRQAVDQARAALGRAFGRRKDAGVLVASCEALLVKIEASLEPHPTRH